MTRRALAILLLLSACAPFAGDRRGGLAEPVMEPEIAAEPSTDACLPGDDDGIGGTGCELN